LYTWSGSYPIFLKKGNPKGERKFSDGWALSDGCKGSARGGGASDGLATACTTTTVEYGVREGQRVEAVHKGVDDAHSNSDDASRLFCRVVVKNICEASHITIFG
jgi:hypothetical protein